MCSTASLDSELKFSGRKTTKSSLVSMSSSPNRVLFTSAFSIDVGVLKGKGFTLFIGGKKRGAELVPLFLKARHDGQLK